jgi:hypothetical protein
MTTSNPSKKLNGPAMKMQSNLLSVLLAGTGFIVAAAPTHAAVTLITPTSATAALQFSPPSPGIEFFPVANIVNNSGLSGAATIANYTTITHSAASGTTAWTTDDPAPGGGDWFAEGNAPVVITLPLDSTYDLTSLVYWGYHFGSGNANEARAFNVEFSTNGGGTWGSSTSVASPLGTLAVAGNITLNFGGTFAANAVRLTITDNQFGGGPAGGDRLGLGEVKFIGDAVPEPTSAVLAGIAACGFLRRKRR